MKVDADRMGRLVVTISPGDVDHVSHIVKPQQDLLTFLLNANVHSPPFHSSKQSCLPPRRLLCV